MNYLKPRAIFENAYKNLNEDISFKTDVPLIEIGGLTLLENSILVVLIKLIKANYIFEFGTYFGSTTKLLAENSNNNSKIYSLDFNPDNCHLKITEDDIKKKRYLKNGKINDEYLTFLYKKRGPFKINAQKKIRKKIKLINTDSKDLDLKKFNLYNKFDLIFIDGGHDYFTIKSDTEKSLLMKKKSSLIVWHDYNSKIHTSVTKYLDLFSTKKKLYHIKNTMLVFAAFGKYSKIKFS